jgi:nucleoside-diphosphate-sugar epimerase
VVGLDIRPSAFTTVVGSIADARVVADAMQGVDAVLHAAALHKPHIVTHSGRDFVDTNVVGTLNLLEAAVSGAAKTFVYTSRPTNTSIAEPISRTSSRPISERSSARLPPASVAIS